MKPEQWERLSSWVNAWMDASPTERTAMRARLAAEDPELVAEADALSSASDGLQGFLETPALVLAARALAEQEALLAPGTMVGPYRVTHLLARGGMGDVYRADDPRLSRPVALKVLAESRTREPHRVERFLQEARVTASLDHPNVVRLHDVGRFEDRAYLVAELLEGETLRTRVARGAMPVEDTLRIGCDIAAGLGAAHAAGLVHRDLKPDNVFLTRSGVTKILDFGIAKLAQDDAVRDGFSTLTGVVLGTAGYLAPEQIRGRDVDARADLFALGAVLYEMLTGTRAFARELIVDTLHAILHDPPPSLAGSRPLPRALAGIVTRLLEKSPDARFQGSADVIAALRAVDPAQDDAVPEAVPPPGAPRKARRRGVALALAALLAALAAGVFHARRAPSPPAAVASPVTLAVMPFRSIAGADGDLLGLGLADVFISRLSRLPGLKVLPLTATERLGGLDPLQAGQRLGATHVLTVSLQRDRDKLRATPVLMATSDGRALWSGTVDTDATSAFVVQDIIVTRVVEDLAPQLAAPARTRLARPATANPAAFQAYLRGRVHLLRPARAEIARAISQFDEAVRLDPAFADAWAALASAHKRRPLFDDRPMEAFAETRSAAARALAIEPGHPEATAALGTVAFWHDWDYARAESLLRRALELQPSSVDAEIVLAHLLSDLGRHDEALLEIRRARALDPAWVNSRSLEGQVLFKARRYAAAVAQLDEVVAFAAGYPHGYTMRVYPLLALGRYADAIRDCDRSIALQLAPDVPGAAKPHSFPLALKGYALARLGRRAEAEAVLAELRGRAREAYVPPHHEALLLHGLGRDDEALDRLRAAVDERDLFATWLGVDPKWDDLRRTPAFREVLEAVHLLEVSDRTLR